MSTSATITTQRTGRAAEVTQPNAGLTYTTKQYAAPAGNEVRLKIQACGVCHSDSFAFTGMFHGLQYPLIPGHEIAAVIDAVGDQVTRLKVGDRVGVGWHGGHCHHCDACRSGDYILCQESQIPGINRSGGYAEYAIFPEEVCALIPDELKASEAAPLLCAGVTTYNSLRNAGAMPGDTVAILGLGGLGHLGVQFANKMGYRTVAIARGTDKAPFARQLGAHEYIDSQSSNAVQVLKALGGASVLLSTITNSEAMTPWIDGLARNGRMVLVGADVEPMQVSPIALLSQRRSIVGWPSGTARDSEDCLRFAALTGVRPMVEVYPFDKAGQAYERMMSGKARFRVVVEF